MRLLLIAVLIAFTVVRSVATPAPHSEHLMGFLDDSKSSVPLESQTDDSSEAKDEKPVIRLGMSLVATHPLEFDWESEFQETKVAWTSLIDEAETSLDLSFFYASDRGQGGDLDPEHPTALSGVVRSLQQAAGRGVAIRFLVDSAFEDTYPALIARLGKVEGIESRILNLKQIAGGVMHAKYMIADSKEFYLGSANFDWRSLEHVLELGMREHHNAGPIVDVFNLDWHLAGGGSMQTAPDPSAAQPYTPYRIRTGDVIFQPPGSDTALPKSKLINPLVTPVFSPKGLLPNEDLWDLPHIIQRIEGAQERIWIQVMTFKLKDRSGEVFHELQDPILAAAKRGVDVRLLVADWGKRKGTIEGLQALAATEGIEVRMTTIPEHSTGHIPFARVIHAKYMVVDQDKAWLGSSNWEKGYFYEGRNVGVLLDGPSAITPLAAFHQSLWLSPHTYKVDPTATYEAPNFGDRK
ncbi:MAG: phosphatidylserine/phosphatidylglycerophosphate/cardiolipin synthase-like enzyme [Bacteroidia bacterium]|jgi:phosphatidylserine/phosphatidylglycerophosphate/cardiolipin synthase-like enzyme